MRIKLACYIEVDIPENATDDQTYSLIEADVLKNRDSYEFVIEEVDGNADDPLVDEVLP